MTDSLAFRLFSALKVDHRFPPSNHRHQISDASAHKICSAEVNAAIATGNTSLVSGGVEGSPA
jgi:hypothetical protein